MNHVILAAGKGSRLMPITLSTPKALLDLDGECTFLDFQIQQSLQSKKIDTVVIVAGYKAEQIQQHIKARYANLPVEVLLNPYFEVDNPILSLFQAQKYLSQAALITNGDTYFETGIFEAIIADSRPVLVAASTLEGDYHSGMVIQAENERFLSVTTDVSSLPDLLTSKRYESAGLFKVSSLQTAALLVRVIETMAGQFFTQRHVWHDILNYLQALTKIEIFDLKDRVWYEVDTPEKLHELRVYLATRTHS